MNYPMERVIFSVDNVTDIYSYSKAIHFLDVLRATQQIKDGVTMCIGSYKGDLEPSFMVSARDWEVILKRGYDFIKDQESVMRIPGDQRQPCVLTSVSGTFIASLGPMKEITDSSVGYYDAWTYVIASGLYFHC